MDGLYNIYLKEKEDGKTELEYKAWRANYLKVQTESAKRGYNKVQDVVNRESCKGCIFVKSYPGKTMTVWQCTAVRDPIIVTVYVLDKIKYPGCPIIRLRNQMKIGRIASLKNFFGQEDDENGEKDDG